MERERAHDILVPWCSMIITLCLVGLLYILLSSANLVLIPLLAIVFLIYKDVKN